MNLSLLNASITAKIEAITTRPARHVYVNKQKADVKNSQLAIKS